MRKLNLEEFGEVRLTLPEKLSFKGGLIGTRAGISRVSEGSTTSRRTHTSCTGSDSDSRRTDSD